MIARTWTARTTADRADAYFAKAREDELPHLRSVPGYRGCRFMRRKAGDAIEILVVTFWESMEAVRAFAGDEPTRAHLPPDIVATLDRYDDDVTHFDVVIDDAAPG